MSTEYILESQVEDLLQLSPADFGERARAFVAEHPDWWLVEKEGHGIIGVSRDKERADEMIANFKE